VIEAADGAEALRHLETRSFDVILSDLRMPGMQGDQFAARLKALGRGLERRLIFITGDAASGEAARILSQLQAPVVMKPFTLQELADRLERHVAEIEVRKDS
jgi:two-component system cell cycle sensor histidine kinase/response regulator CckA